MPPEPVPWRLSSADFWARAQFLINFGVQDVLLTWILKKCPKLCPSASKHACHGRRNFATLPAAHILYHRVFYSSFHFLGSLEYVDCPYTRFTSVFSIGINHTPSHLGNKAVTVRGILSFRQKCHEGSPRNVGCCFIVLEICMLLPFRVDLKERFQNTARIAQFTVS